MSKLPNPHKAIIQLEKIKDYCLNPEHPVGKHKAIVFKRKLGITSADSIELMNLLIDTVKNNDAIESFSDKFGKRFYIDLDIERLNYNATVRSIWIVRSDEDFPRFISCYVKN